MNAQRAERDHWQNVLFCDKGNLLFYIWHHCYQRHVTFWLDLLKFLPTITTIIHFFEKCVDLFDRSGINTKVYIMEYFRSGLKSVLGAPPPGTQPTGAEIVSRI